MPLKQELIELQNFAGGLNLTSDAFHVGDSETADCQNVDFDVRGAVKKRDGYTVYNNAGTEARDFLLPFTLASAVTKLVVAAPSAAIFQVNDSGAKSAISGATSQSAATTHDGVVIKGAAYIINGTDQTAKWDGTTFTRLGITLGATGNMPKANTICVHKNRIFLGNCDAGVNKSRIRYSGSDATPTDVEYYKSTSFIDVQQDDGDQIQKLLPFLDSLLIFKRNSTWVLRGNNPRDFELVLANPSVGCVAPRTAQAWDKGVIFLSARGVFSFDGSKVVRLSEKIDPAINALPLANLSQANGVVFQQKYYLFVHELGGTSYPDTVYVFDFISGTWSKYRAWSVWHAVVWNRVGGEEVHAVNAADRTQSLQLKSGTSDGGLANLVTDNQFGVETDTTGFSATTNCSILRVTTQFHSGVASLQITATAAADMVAGHGGGVGGRPVNPLKRYGAKVWVKANAATRQTKTSLFWYDSGGSLITQTDSPLVTDSSSVWTQFSVPLTPPPANAAFVANKLTVVGAAAAEVHFADDWETFDDGAINAYFTTKWLDFGIPERRKMHRRMYAWFQSAGAYDVTIDVQRNYAASNAVTNVVSLDPGGMTWGASLWGAALWGLGQDIVRSRLTGIGTSPSIRVKVRDNSTNPWTFEGLAFVLQPRNLA